MDAERKVPVAKLKRALSTIKRDVDAKVVTGSVWKLKKNAVVDRLRTLGYASNEERTHLLRNAAMKDHKLRLPAKIAL